MSWTNGPGDTDEFDVSDERADLPSNYSYEDGDGGDDMEFWSYDLQDRYYSISYLEEDDWENNSSYDVYEGQGLIDVTWGEYQVVYSSDKPEEDSVESSGSGGDDMDLWSLSMEEKYDFLSAKEKKYWSDNSSYGVFDEVGFLHPTWGKYDERSEKVAGHFVRGTVSDVDGEDLDVYINLVSPDGDTIDTYSVSGKFTKSLGPLPSVERGPDSEYSENYDVEIEPEVGGIPAVEELDVLELDFGEIQYSEINGSISDSEGSPVQGVTVSSEGVRVESDKRGKYSILGPGGIDVTMESFDGKYSKEVSLRKGEVNNVDWQYAGLYITVYLPGDIEAVGVPIEISHNNNIDYTNESGIVEFTEVPPDYDGEYTIFDNITGSVKSGPEGKITELTENVGSGVTGIIRVSGSLDRISGVDASIESDGKYSTVSNESGRYATGNAEYGVVTLVIAEDDGRYETYKEEIEIDEGDLIEKDIDLNESVAIGTY